MGLGSGCVGSQLGPAAAGDAAACDSSSRPPEVVVPDEVEPHRQQVERNLVHGPFNAM